MGRVNFRRVVDYKVLETALVRSAEELGWKVKVRDEFSKDYELGSVKEVPRYEHTNVNLSRWILPMMKVRVYGKGPISDFTIFNDFSHGFVSKRRVKEYLDAVSRNLG